MITEAAASVLALKLQTGQTGAILQGIVNALSPGEIDSLASAIAIMEVANDDDDITG